MPVIPFAAAVGGALGTSAAVGGTVIAGTALAAGLGIANAVGSASAAAAAKKQAADAQNAAANTPGTTVGDPTLNNNGNLGRAALISTSPSGVSGLDPTGRRSLLGN